MLLLFQPFHLLNPYNLKSAIGTAAYHTDRDYWKTANITMYKDTSENCSWKYIYIYIYIFFYIFFKSEENYILIYLSGTQANLLWIDV